MTLFKGILLFDIAEKPIGKWENQLGYRGMMEIWKHENGDRIIIEVFEHDTEEHLSGKCECHEVWMHDKKGNLDTLGVWSSFEESDRNAKAFMKENPDGAFNHE